MTIVCGIDVGLDGALTLLDSSGSVLGSYITPTIGDGKRQYNLAFMCDLLRPAIGVDYVWLEKSQPMQGGSRGSNGDESGKRGSPASNFGMGFGYAAWQMALVALKLPYEIVAPRTWQKDMHKDVTASNTKAKSELVCKRLWPTVDWRKNGRCRVFHDGKGDSACIAEWGRRQLVQRGLLT